MRVVSVEQMRELERLTFESGVSEDELQRRAGTAVADAVRRIKGQPGAVVALVGPGNNGRDAYIAADNLRTAGWSAVLFLTPRHTLANHELRNFTADGGGVVEQPEGTAWEVLKPLLGDADVVLDGLLGIGGRGALRPPIAEVAEACYVIRERSQRLLVVAVDVPSGLDADTGEIKAAGVRADATIVLGGAKQGLLTPGALRNTGRLIFADIGVVDGPSDAPELVTEHSVQGLLGSPQPDAHKGTFGRLLVVAGSERYVGAAYLVSAAAVRAGAGIVTLAAPRWLRDVVAAQLPEVTYLPLPDAGPAGAAEECAQTILGELGNFSALAIGPGLSTDGGVVQFVDAVLRGRAKGGTPAVVDADGLNCLARLDGWPNWLGDGVVITPHLGELRRLAPAEHGNRRPWEIVHRLSREWPATLLLKGPFTAIGVQGRTWVHARPNPALATGGTGDVLTGIIGGLLSRGLTPASAAQLAVWAHGQAGAQAATGKNAGGLQASDLLPDIPTALAEIAIDMFGTPARRRLPL